MTSNDNRATKQLFMTLFILLLGIFFVVESQAVATTISANPANNTNTYHNPKGSSVTASNISSTGIGFNILNEGSLTFSNGFTAKTISIGQQITVPQITNTIGATFIVMGPAKFPNVENSGTIKLLSGFGIDSFSTYFNNNQGATLTVGQNTSISVSNLIFNNSGIINFKYKLDMQGGGGIL